MTPLMNPLKLSLLLALTSLPAPAFAAEPGDLAALSVDQGADRAGQLDAAVADPKLSDAQLAALGASPDWQVRQGAALVAAWRADAELAAELTAAPLMPTRAGIGRLQHEALGTPAARAVLADRLLRDDASSLDRMGLAHALSVDPATDPVVLAGLIKVEHDPEVRAVLVWGWKANGDSDAAQAGLAAALSDADPAVRSRAAEAAAYLSPEAPLQRALTAGLADASPQVRAKCARAVGWQEVGAAFGALTPLLSDADADVRLQALSAMQRIDKERTAALPQLVGLTEDADPKVARLAASLR